MKRELIESSDQELDAMSAVTQEDIERARHNYPRDQIIEPYKELLNANLEPDDRTVL